MHVVVVPVCTMLDRGRHAAHVPRASLGRGWCSCTLLFHINLLSPICKDSELVSYIAERYMLDYERQGRLKDLVMLRNLQDDMLISPHLLFLGGWGHGGSAAVGLSVLVPYLSVL